MNGTFERKTITVPFYPEVLRIGRQTNNKTIPTPLNGYFDSKVLSRQHAEVWADRSGKIWIRDVKSSNGTFVNGQRLSQENRDSDPHELREQDMLELGIDIVSEDQKSIVHHKVAARVEHAGIYANLGTSVMDLNFGELENQQLPNVMGSANQQQIQNMRGRTPSQGSINSGRLQGAMGATANSAAMQQPRHPNFWLQPITMEQVVKKLNVSHYKCA
jgi:pSer/pThr/pTyr-binding forkhead associated (FHA) protein